MPKLDSPSVRLLESSKIDYKQDDNPREGRLKIATSSLTTTDLAAEHLESLDLMPVVINANPELFQAGEAPDAALYCGWYSLAQYVDAFDWRRGAIGYHIASGECETLRAGPGQGWCKRMLEDGVAATIGPVSEPYIQAFPEPDVFFKLLTSGAETLVEAYFHSQRYLSWQMVLIGDPLYRPFKE